MLLRLFVQIMVKHFQLIKNKKICTLISLNFIQLLGCREYSIFLQLLLFYCWHF
ncbi:hypothetical protein NTHI1209_02165 [Haemophilus influenzae]|uniref:Uncharacterized protein n=1 Tax=Haemophilus influenzae TaxID=727 RepID=A0A158T066_HAEIF|nr:hypothetical protein NTHI1209_02165 [Haemophilus influenzae]